MKKILLILFILIGISAYSQDTLPKPPVWDYMIKCNDVIDFINTETLIESNVDFIGEVWCDALRDTSNNYYCDIPNTIRIKKSSDLQKILVDLKLFENQQIDLATLKSRVATSSVSVVFKQAINKITLIDRTKIN